MTKKHGNLIQLINYYEQKGFDIGDKISHCGAKQVLGFSCRAHSFGLHVYRLD